MPAITLPVVAVSISVSVAVSIPVPVPVSVLIAPFSRDPFERRVLRNVVLRIHALHAFFHAVELVAVVRPPVVLPTRKITVKACLIAFGQPVTPLTTVVAIIVPARCHPPIGCAAGDPVPLINTQHAL